MSAAIMGQYYRCLAVYIRDGCHTPERLKRDVYPEETFVMSYVKQKFNLFIEDPWVWLTTLDDTRLGQLVKAIGARFHLPALPEEEQ